MSDSRQVKVDNWGIYFLQRLKHFFNRTDYCDLTLQFQDNAQLKVHRLVLSACTEYFELLERTCEMYEDCLVMPDDLQADVVVPIINFMYTGQLEFKLEMLEKLYQTSLIMNMPVLTKLLDAHRPQQKQPPAKPAFSSSSNYYGKRYSKFNKPTPFSSNSNNNKRSYSNAFDNLESQSETQKTKKTSSEPFSKAECIVKNGTTPSYQFPIFSEKNKRLAKEARPTRYELPEELDEENIFDNSFTNISYTSKPLMVHPETVKQYGPKRINLFDEGTSSSRFMHGPSNDIVECRKISATDGFFEDPLGDSIQDDSNFHQQSRIKDEAKDTSQLFDQILENNTSKITIETKNSGQTHNIDHAKIISEVLKKYPHLVKSNKNIKLKILNTAKTKKSQVPGTSTEEKVKQKATPDFTYESDVINSKEAARLIALGAENVAGPWICLICGTPGKALHFTSYFNFRKHLVEVHNEKPVPSICEYCGVKSQKRNYLVHHKLTKHGVPPPAPYSFPKCNHCNYIALNEALLIKHKSSHSDKCYKFNLPSNLMGTGLPKTGQKYPGAAVSPDRKNNLQCIYCQRIFLREYNLYAHMKTVHKEAAKNDGIIDDSEDEQEEDKFSNLKSNSNESSNMIKIEVPVNFDNSYEDVSEQYQIEQKSDGGIFVLTKKPRVMLPTNKNKILNLGFSSIPNISSVTHIPKTDSTPNISLKGNEFSQNTYVTQARSLSSGDTVVIDNIEYFLQDNQLLPKKDKMTGEYVISHSSNNSESQSIPTTSIEQSNIQSLSPEHKILVKKSTHVNQPLQIVVSNEEEYKALINSNQSIIYNEEGTNKSMPELETTDTLDTGTIDLDNTQSNEMMIIPDDFPINVSETVSSDNSNIVVVYSHPVDDHNKQFSLISTQGITSEFVQSSAILAQNYETVTTCTPVVTTALEGSWQHSVHANIDKMSIAPPSELQAIAVGESITIAPIENVASNTLTAITADQLSTSEPVTLEITQNENITTTFQPDQSNIITTITEQSSVVPNCPQNTIITLSETSSLENMQQQTVAQLNSTSDTNLGQTNSISSFNEISSLQTLEGSNPMAPTDVVASSSHTFRSADDIILHENENEIVKAIVPDSQDTLTCVQSVNENSDCQINDNSDNLEPIASTCSIVQEHCEEEHKLEEQLHQSDVEETIENIAKDIDNNQNALNNSQQSVSVQNSKDVDVDALTEIAKEQIENLTSEWSEEESEVTLANQSNMSNEKSSIPAELAEAEESIENIQKEVEKQVSQKLDIESEDKLSCHDDDSSLPLQGNAKSSDNVDSHEKISLLLNDWDDNDSQDDDPSTITDNQITVQPSNSVTQNIDASTDVTTHTTPDNSSKTETDSDAVDTNPGDDTTAVVHKSDPIKNDKIKVLVSDWDEDEEDEIKE